jgi:hypothetical protein
MPECGTFTPGISKITKHIDIINNVLVVAQAKTNRGIEADNKPMVKIWNGNMKSIRKESPEPFQALEVMRKGRVKKIDTIKELRKRKFNNEKFRALIAKNGVSSRLEMDLTQSQGRVERNITIVTRLNADPVIIGSGEKAPGQLI